MFITLPIIILPPRYLTLSTSHTPIFIRYGDVVDPSYWIPIDMTWLQREKEINEEIQLATIDLEEEVKSKK